ncbi:MAG TPA: alpha-L-fucosidase, partial [Bacteroidota bacterium]|nr:alpha-L-fucosidase [Bacteroidota bacterium]
VLTCKHHDGFCLWQSQYTEHSVKNSPWKEGKGDIVKELSEACRRYGMKFGVYLSPWDRNHKDYGRPEYITYYRNQLRELLTNYGEISEVWFDGANGGDGYYGGARETRTIDRTTYYGWNETWNLVRQLQPDAAIFSDVGPDIRWIGNENGIAGTTCWSMYTPVGEKDDDPAPGYTRYQDAVEGNENGKFWLPAECDVSIRPGWFYHANEDSLVKTPEQLFDLYLQSVGHNASLLLNVPLDRKGQISSADEMSLRGLKIFLDQTFTDNIASKAKITASSFRGNETRFSPINTLDDDYETYWTTDDSTTTGSVTVDLPSPQECNCLLLREYIPMGQRVEKFSVDELDGSDWQTIAEGTTIGYNRLLKFPAVKTSQIRITILQSKACPVISTIGIYTIPNFQTEMK